MKKNVMMRVASVLLVAVMLTTCAISGTFAKYVSSETGSDTARVAKWGVTVTAPGKTFSKAYKDLKEDNAALQTVVSTTDNVVAPGTEGTLSMFEVAGSPEVDVRVSYNATIDLGDNWTLGGSFYCPIVVTVVYNGNTEVFTAEGKTVTQFEEAIENFINTNCAVVYDAGAPLDTVNDDLTVSWKWFFENTTPGNPLSSYQTDDKDSDLGDLTADLDLTNDPEITFTIKCTVTQVD